jgi:hypothetical protein
VFGTWHLGANFFLTAAATAAASAAADCSQVFGTMRKALEGYAYLVAAATG